MDILKSSIYIGGCSNLTSININNTKDSISGAPKGMKAVIWNR